MFKKYETLFFQIKNKLLGFEDLRKLVFYNTPNALSLPTPTVEEAAQSIYIKPVIYVYQDSPEYGLSSFISIGLVEGIVLDGSINTTIKISIACDRKIWEMENNRVRPLAILSEISKLDLEKFDLAGKLTLKVIKEIYFNNDLVGYTALFTVDGEKGNVVNEF